MYDDEEKLEIAIKTLQRIYDVKCEVPDADGDKRWCCQMGQWAFEALQKLENNP